MKQFWDSNKDKILILIFLAAFAIIYSFISVSSHNHFETFGWDLGFFDQIIWKASRGDLKALSTLNFEFLLADHFQPVLYLLAPLYLIKSDVRMILIAQSFLVVFAAYPLYLLAINLSKNKAFSISVVFSYLLFTGTQWLILNEFHQMAFLPLFLAITFYSLQKKSLFYYWLSIIGLFMIKEELALLVSSLGVLVLFRYRQIKNGFITFFLGLVTFFFLVYFLMPILSLRGEYAHMGFGEAGLTPVDVIRKSITEPVFFIKNMFYPYIKVRTLIETFFSFGFLPIFTPLYLIPIFENFVTRFIYAGPQFTKWINVNQHAAPLGILLAVSAIYSSCWIIGKMQKRYKVRRNILWIVLGLYLFFFSALQDIILHGPINSIFKKQLYESSDWMKDNEIVIKQIPKYAKVATQNSMFPHISQRDKIYLLPDVIDAEYILVDLRDGPNKFSPISYDQTVKFVQKMLSTKMYSIFYQRGQTILLKKNY